MFFTIIGAIENIALIARGKSIKELNRLEKIYGKGSWRKLKGIAHIEMADGRRYTVEVHWYEAHGIGKKEEKIKRFL